MNQTIVQTIGARLRARRQELGYSQEFTAEKAGLHPTYIGQVERGEKNITIESLEKICRALEYPMDRLFCNLVTDDHSLDYAVEMYNIMIEHPRSVQGKLLHIITEILKLNR